MKPELLAACVPNLKSAIGRFLNYIALITSQRSIMKVSFVFPCRTPKCCRTTFYAKYFRTIELKPTDYANPGILAQSK